MDEFDKLTAEIRVGNLRKVAVVLDEWLWADDDVEADAMFAVIQEHWPELEPHHRAMLKDEASSALGSVPLSALKAQMMNGLPD